MRDPTALLSTMRRSLVGRIVILASFIEVSIKRNGEALVACVLKSTSSTTLDAEGGLDVGSDTGCWKLLTNTCLVLSLCRCDSTFQSCHYLDHVVLAKREERLRRKIAWRKHVNMFTRRRHLTTKKKKVSTMSRSSTAANDLSKKSK